MCSTLLDIEKKEYEKEKEDGHIGCDIRGSWGVKRGLETNKTIANKRVALLTYYLYNLHDVLYFTDLRSLSESFCECSTLLNLMEMCGFPFYSGCHQCSANGKIYFIDRYSLNL